MLISDKAVISEGRKQPLKDVDAPLRDQVVKKLFDKLEEMEIAVKVEQLWTRGNSNRATWLERQSAYLASWDEHLINDAHGAFEGSSKLHIPMPFVVCKTLHARFLQAIWQDPPLNIKARREALMERVPVIQDTMRFYLRDGMNYGKGVESIVDKWVWDVVTTGSGLMKQRWDITYTRYIDVEEKTEEGPLQFEVVNGEEVQRPTTKKVEKETVVTKKCFDGPVLDIIDVEDLLIVGGAGDPDLADAVLHRQYLTASELWTLVDRKIFDKDAVEEIIEHGGDRVDNGKDVSGIKQQRAQNAGYASPDGESLDRYEIIEAHLKLDVDGSGVNSDVICWVNPGTRRLVRATYLYRVNKRGERPFIKADYHLRKGQEFGTGIPELLYPLSREMDAMHNMRIDFGLISVMPFGFYRASSGLDPETIQLEPGALIPVDNPATDVYFPNLGNRTVFGMQEEQAIQSMVERISSVNDMSLGMLNQQGAARTATGARALQGESSSNLDVHLRRINLGWKKALRLTLHALQQRMPAGTSFRLTGDDGAEYFRTVNQKDDIDGDYDIEVSSNSSTSNAGIQQDVAQQILNLTSNPLDIQLGVITAAQRFEALKNWYQAFGVKDYGRYLNKPQGPTRVLTPVEEADRVLAGIDVPITPEMDHDGFIQFVDMFMKDDHLHGQLLPEHIMALAAQAKKHEGMKQALQQMQAQQANARQMQQNSAQSAQQVAPSMPAQAPMAQAQPGQPQLG